MQIHNFPDSELLLTGNIRPFLQTKIIGRKIFYYQQLTSTSEKAKRLAAEGAEEGTLVIAETQSGGQGRLGRGWHSPFGKGVWVSVILRPPFKVSDTAKCTLLAAVAVSLAIEETAQISCGIKWPNDILWQGRKLVGILTEMSADMNGLPYLVIGIGINVNIKEDEFGPDISAKATSLCLAAQREINRAELLASFLERLEELYKTAQEKGFAPILAEWRVLSATLGEEVCVLGQNESFTGLAVDIDDDGALLVKTAKGLEKVLAGDVSIRKI